MSEQGAHFARESYRLPEPGLVALVDAAPTPRVVLAPNGELAALLHPRGRPTIADLARAELRMAGLRWHPHQAAAVRGELIGALQLMDLTDGQLHAIDNLPEPLVLSEAAWSPDGNWLAFSHHDQAAGEVQLWGVDCGTRRACRWPAPALHAVVGCGFTWASDSRRLLLLVRPPNRPEPLPDTTPPAPLVEDTSPQDRGRQTRTFTDLLRSRHDERLFEHHLLSQLVWLDLTGEVTLIGGPALHLAVEPSPDGQLLLVQRLETPFSHRVPVQRFARSIEVLDNFGARRHVVARLEAAEQLPAGFDAVPLGPREVQWRADADATLAWVCAADGGDPDQLTTTRDGLWQQAAPFDAPPRCLLELPLRFGQVYWGNGELAIVMARWWRSRALGHWRIAPDRPENALVQQPFHQGSLEDRYADPGQPVTRADARGRQRLVIVDGHATLWTGDGASAQGDRPFIDHWNLYSGTKLRCFQSAAPYHERPLMPLDERGECWLTSREAPDEPPQLHLLHLAAPAACRALTQWPHPTPQLRGLRRQTLHYRRADGVPLSATLWLPPGHEPERDGPLPVLMWAYPMEFVSADVAGQVSGSPFRFHAIDVLGPVPLAAAGYAVLDNPSMPIIGSAERPGNDSFLPQLLANAEAAVADLMRRGVAEPQRIAIGGHSFGAFMAANLLAHSRLFAAGIARSGAYNRTLTPFGFQSEERHYWQARAMYRAISPFDEADKIAAPLLLVHGQADANSGTFPMQSERMFAALRALGGTARLVLLPHEGHRYAARESILQVLAEMQAWLDRYVKGAPAAE
jgi:dipeptidyl aminopeptidase/acylaminoacyl peptidase